MSRLIVAWVGVLLIVAGVWVIYWPAALIVAGLFLLLDRAT